MYKWLFKEFSQRKKKKKAVAGSGKQERKGKEAKQMRDFRPNPSQLDSVGSLLIAQSCPTLCNPMDCIPPGSSVHGILQTRKLEWVAIFFSKGSSYPGIEPGFPAL